MEMFPDLRRRDVMRIGYKIQLGLIIACLFQLLSADSYYEPYLLVFGLGIFALLYKAKRPEILLEQKVKTKILVNSFALLLSLCIWLANYEIFKTVPRIAVLLQVIILCGGTYCTFYYIFLWIICFHNLLIWEKFVGKIFSAYVFWGSFVIIIICNAAVLLLCKYPGVLTSDSISQLEQFLYGHYSNHHPIFHTMLIHLFVSVGMFIWNDMNAAVALYSMFSIIFMATCFSYALKTLADMQVPKKIIIMVFLFYLLMPYHIMYSFTMWKDVIFGGFVLLFTLSFFRVYTYLGNNLFNHVIFFASSVGVCLFRSNGIFAYALVFICTIILFWNSNKKSIIIMFLSLFLSMLIKQFGLASLGVAGPDTIEMLSIPAQQIARVIATDNDLKEKERELIGELVDFEAIPQIYSRIGSDPVKNHIRNVGNQYLLQDRKWDYLKVYISIGIKHPVTYLTAWIDETRGFWNAGYDYWRWLDWVDDNDYGIERVVISSGFNKFIDEYLTIYTDLPILRLLLCIGLVVWMNLISLYISIVRKDKVGIVASVPILAIVLSLIISTPVFAEFRYIYSAFCCIPIIGIIVCRPLSFEK